jgi:hypothetical protein
LKEILFLAENIGCSGEKKWLNQIIYTV